VTCAFDSPLHSVTCEEDTYDIKKNEKLCSTAPEGNTKKLQNWTTSMHIGSASKFLLWIAKVDSDFFSLRETGRVHKTSTITVGNSELIEFSIIF
jgi:hypothetical protein